MAGAGDESDAEALDVVIGVGQRVNFQLAAVARSGIDLADRQRASEYAQDCFLQPGDDDHLVRGRGRRLGLDAALGDLAQDVEHG